jgi:hypothetical protein
MTALPSPLTLTQTERFTVLGFPAEPNDPTPHGGLESLPTDALAHVMEFLSYSDAFNYTAVSSMLLHQVASLVKEVTISHTRELLTRAASRFPNVKMIVFSSPGGSIEKEPGLVSGLVPFLKSFCHLERVIFADAIKVRLQMLLQIPDETGELDWESSAYPIENIIRVLCDAFHSNTLSSNVKVEELFCPRIHRHDEQCHLCRQVVKSFPVRDLLVVDEEKMCICMTFEHGLGLQDAQDWMMHIIVRRPGGGDAIRALYNQIPPSE